MRLNKYLAHCGVASRRKCDELIKTGKVKINGQVTNDFSFNVTEDDTVQLKNKIIELTHQQIIYLMNKPAGVISTSSDPQGRDTVVNMIPSDDRLYTIGRLDRDTTGALLITNDGDLAYKLTHPKFHVEKIYLAITKTDISNEKLKEISASGQIKLDAGDIAHAKIKRLERYKGKIYWEVTLTEGKNREVKRIFTALDSKVEQLHRRSFAGISADKLKLGKFRKLMKKELKQLNNLNI